MQKYSFFVANDITDAQRDGEEKSSGLKKELE